MGQDAGQRWQQRYDAAVAAGKVRNADFTTLSGVEVDPVYGPADEASVPGFERIGYPGEFPFTRGLHATGYRGRAWTIRQFAGFGNARQTNERYKMILAEGGGGLSVAFDMPTLMGRDSDDPRSLGEVGHCGVAVDSAVDMDELFDGIPLGDTTTSMTISGPAVPVFCMYLVAAERQGAAVEKLNGTLHTDFFKEIAKFRAARRIWARWLRDVYGATTEKAQQLRFHTQTAGVSLTAQQPDNNIVRTAVEALTAELERQAEEIFARIKDMGTDQTMTSGILRGIEEGWFTGEIAEAAFVYQRALEKGDKKVVGVNTLTGSVDAHDTLEILRVSHEVERDQKDELAARRQGPVRGRRARADRLPAERRGPGRQPRLGRGRRDRGDLPERGPRPLVP